MSIVIRNITENDRTEVMNMMKEFYASPAVLSNGSDEIFKNDIDNCIGDCPYLKGFIFEQSDVICGYAMVAKSFSTESGCLCVWIEDLFIKKDFRGLGIGSRFMEFITNKYSDAVLRLEVEKENEKAVGVYVKNGFELIPYMEMIKYRKQ